MEPLIRLIVGGISVVVASLAGIVVGAVVGNGIDLILNQGIKLTNHVEDIRWMIGVPIGLYTAIKLTRIIFAWAYKQT